MKEDDKCLVCDRKLSSQKDIGLRVGMSASVISQMRRDRPAQYRALMLGVLVEHCLGIDKANYLIQSCVGNTKVLPTVWELLYEE